MLYDQSSNLNDFHVFGSLCFPFTIENNGSKLDARVRKCVFVGYKVGTKSYIIFICQTKKYLCQEILFFYENIFSYKASNIVQDEIIFPLRRLLSS